MAKKQTIANRNQLQIESLEQNTFFNHAFTNKIGNELAKYLQSTSYYTLQNPDPVDKEKNTLAKVFNHLKVIDIYVNKPLNEYKPDDLNRFITDFRDGQFKKNRTYLRTKNGKIITEVKKTDKIREPSTLRRYLGEFKRLWKVYYEWTLNDNVEQNKKRAKKIIIDPMDFQWGFNLKSPRMRKKYEDYPWFELDELISFSKNLHKLEYIVRFLLSLNLMGRRCEISEVKYKDIDFRKDGNIFIKLPDVKKFSAFKVPVELYTYAKEPLLRYLKTKKWEPEDQLFPTKSEAFAKNLKRISKTLLGNEKGITPKMLRKLGVCVAEQFEISRSDVERIGGWSVNSEVLNHYFNRKGVKAKVQADNKIERTRNESVYVELDRIKIEEKKKQERIDELERKMQDMHKLLLESTSKRDNVVVIESKDLAKKIWDGAESKIGE